MEVTCNDPVFGKMSYKHRWIKQQTLLLFGKEWNITVAAKAYSGKAITEEQRKSYLSFMNEQKKMMQTVTEELYKYVIMKNRETSVEKIKENEELAQILNPKTLLFQQDGTTILLLDYAWDIEHGIAVKLIPEIAVGIQDLFL